MASDGYAIRFDGVAYAAAQERLLAAVLAMPASSSRARPGIRVGGGLSVTVGGTPEAATVAPGGGIITDTGAGVGSYIFVIPSPVARNLATRPSVGQTRLDEIVALIKNGDERVGDGVGVHEIDIALLTGTATSGTPTAPTVPSGQLRLAELLVPASAAVTVQKPPPRTVALGGILPLASQAERDAIEVLYDGLATYREDIDTFVGLTAGVWRTFIQAAASGDDTWTDLTLGSGFAHQSSTEKSQVIRHAGMATVILAQTKASFANGDVIATVPAGFRPVADTGRSRIRIVGQYGAAARYASLLNDGSGQIVADGAQTTGIITAPITFPVA